MQSERVAREGTVIKEDAADTRDDAEDLNTLIREGVEKAHGSSM